MARRPALIKRSSVPLKLFFPYLRLASQASNMASLVKAAWTLVALVIVFISGRAFALRRNYHAAKEIGLPIIVRLGSWQDPLWMIFGPAITKIFCNIGLWDPNATDYSAFGWPLKDRYATHKRLGPAFTLVTPFKNNVLIADAAAAQVLYKDWRSWIKDPMLYSMMEAFGRNVVSVNGNDWQRHRKITAPAFKEANSKLVWKASLAQAQGAKMKWAALSTDPTKKNGVSLGQLRTDTSTIAMHVLSSAGMGKEFSFGHGVEKAGSGTDISYAEAMHIVVSNISPMLVPLTFAATKLPSSIVPSWLKKLQVAVKSVRKNLEDSVADECMDLANGKPGTDNLLSTLVRANEEEKNATGGGGKRFALTDEELYGNLFMFNQAGFETTSGALSSAIPLLAIHPDVQAWVREEVDAVFATADQNDYAVVFPRLVRCEALLVCFDYQSSHLTLLTWSSTRHYDSFRQCPSSRNIQAMRPRHFASPVETTFSQLIPTRQST